MSGKLKGNLQTAAANVNWHAGFHEGGAGGPPSSFEDSCSGLQRILFCQKPRISYGRA